MPNNQPTANSNLVISNHITDMLDDLPQSQFLNDETLKNNDRLRQQMHEDLIDSYDEEIESEMDDYIQDLRYDGQPLTDSQKIARHIYFNELIRLQKENKQLLMENDILKQAAH